MSEYVFLFINGEMQSPEVMQRQMEHWMAWIKDLGERGVLANPGHPLERAGKRVSGRDKTITDCAFTEAKDVIGGFMVVRARDLEAATEISRGCPVFNVGGAVEVRPVMKL